MIQKKPRGRPKKQHEISEFACIYCKKELSSEKYLLNHLCEQKRRVLQRNERSVIIGFHAFQRFWKKCMNPKHTPTWDDFEKKSLGLYSSFVKFGRYVLNINAINPLGFVDFLLRGEIAIDSWCKDYYYQAYVRELTKLETPLEALTRNMMLMEQWALENNEHWTNFFKKVAPTQAVLWILSGRISPWILLTANTAHEMFDRFNEEQIKLANSVIDEKFWEAKMINHEKELKYITEELKENGI